jgi:lipopolysaccharide export system permease protein
MAYAIVKHNLMDINIVFQKGIVYSVLGTVVTGIYLILVIFIGKLFPDGSLGNIAIYETGVGHQIVSITQAERAFHLEGKWTLQGITKNKVTEDGVTTETIPTQPWNSLLNPRIVGAVSVNPDFLPITSLHQYIDYLHDNGLNAQVYEQAFWKKILSPLATGVMVFLGVPFVFGPLRSVPMGPRVVVGAFVGIGFYIATQVVGFAGQVYGFNSFMVVFSPVCVFFLLGVLLTRRVL